MNNSHITQIYTSTFKKKSLKWIQLYILSLSISQSLNFYFLPSLSTCLIWCYHHRSAPCATVIGGHCMQEPGICQQPSVIYSLVVFLLYELAMANSFKSVTCFTLTYCAFLQGPFKVYGHISLDACSSCILYFIKYGKETRRINWCAIWTSFCKWMMPNCSRMVFLLSSAELLVSWWGQNLQGIIMSI